MAALNIDGRELAKRLEGQLRSSVSELAARNGISPCLAIVLVGENPLSTGYVRSKKKRAEDCGILVREFRLRTDSSQEEVNSQLQTLSGDASVHGILLQLPLPPHLNELEALLCIRPAADIDGLHPYNQGLLLRGLPCPLPCTAKACLLLIQEARELLGFGKSLSGCHAVVVGRSSLVGKPTAMLLLSEGCTVTLCHSQTLNLQDQTRQADILVSAAGSPNLITRESVKPGAIVIDVGITQIRSGKIAGDVDTAAVAEMAGAITPVPGGVGPMTIAALLSNVVAAAGI